MPHSVLHQLLTLPLPILLLLAVFLLTAIRKIGRIQFPIWILMCGAAVIVLITRDISFFKAWQAIDINVLAYLFGVFVIAQALEESGYLEHLLLKIFQKARNRKILLGYFILFSSILSILLMNDTAAIVGVPAILLICKKTKIPPLPLLLTLAFCATISSVMSPIGNPQNLLIANQMTKPFLLFLGKLTIPTLINIALLYGYMLICFKETFKGDLEPLTIDVEVDKKLARLGLISFSIMIAIIVLEILGNLLNLQFHLPFGIIAIASAAPTLLFSEKRFILMRDIDWRTLFFFLGLFIFIEAVWLSGYFQALIKDLHLNVDAKSTIVGSSLILSPLISNVPLVALYIPLLNHASADYFLILAMASTLAGNLIILGAASNVIILQGAEKRGVTPFRFIQFMIYGVPLTLINVLVYLLFFGML